MESIIKSCYNNRMISTGAVFRNEKNAKKRLLIEDDIYWNQWLDEESSGQRSNQKFKNNSEEAKDIHRSDGRTIAWELHKTRVYGVMGINASGKKEPIIEKKKDRYNLVWDLAKGILETQPM